MAFLTLACTATAQAARPTPKTRVEIRTTVGTIVVALYNETPLHRDNFLKLVKEQYYDSTLFHRVVPGFMIQGGDPDSKRNTDHMTALGSGGPGYTLPAEIDPLFIHKKGALAAVRLADDENPERRSSGSQFYIVDGSEWSATDLDRISERRNIQDPGHEHHYSAEQVKAYAELGGSPHLDGAYTIFGEVIEGWDVIDTICKVSCDQQDRPLTDVRMWMRVLP